MERSIGQGRATFVARWVPYSLYVIMPVSAKMVCEEKTRSPHPCVVCRSASAVKQDDYGSCQRERFRDSSTGVKSGIKGACPLFGHEHPCWKGEHQR